MTRRAGRITFSLLILAISFAISEYLILLTHLISSSRAAEARNVLIWSSLQQKRHQKVDILPGMTFPHRRVETDPIICHMTHDITGTRELVPHRKSLGQGNSPPFLYPRLPATVTDLPPSGHKSAPDRDLSWALIDLSGRNNDDTKKVIRRPPSLRVLKVKAKRLKEKLSRQNSLAQTMDTAKPEAELAGRNGASRPRVLVLGDNNEGQKRLSYWFWWMPLGHVQRCSGWTDVSGKSAFFCASYLAGSTLLMACLSLLTMSIGVLTWWRKTSQPACLNEFTQVQLCSTGWGFTAAWISVLITAGCVYLHLKTPLLCESINARRQKIDR